MASLLNIHKAVHAYGLDLLNKVAGHLASLPAEQKKVVDEALEKVRAELGPVPKAGRGKKGGKLAADGEPAPKRAPSAYNKFMGEKMKELGAKEPNLNKSELMKKVALLWREQNKK